MLCWLTGARSAPPVFGSTHPEIREYYQRRAGLQKEVQKTLLKSKLDRLVAYQERLSKEIDDLERGCGDVGIRVPKPNVPDATGKTKLK